MLGGFLEIAVSTPDIRASHDWYTGLGLGSALTGDIWAHPYGVMTNGPLALGLHGRSQPSLALVFVRENVALLGRELQALGVRLDSQQLGADVFNQLGFRDPAGLTLQVLEARSFSPPAAPPEETALGRFLSLTLPVRAFEPLADFWQRLGYATIEEEIPWRHLRVIGHVPLTYHLATLHDEALLLFRQPDLRRATATLGDADADQVAAARFRSPVASPHLLLASPEGLRIALLA